MARLISPPTGLRAAWYWVRNWIIKAIAAGFVAHLISLPLVAWHFGQTNPWAIACSIFLEPFVGASLMAAMLKTLLTLLVPSAASVLASLAAMPSIAMRGIVRAMAHWPAAQLQLPPLPWIILPLYALLAALPLVPLFRRWRFAWIGPLVALLFAALLPLWAAIFSPHANQGVRLTVISVGNGSSMLLELPDGSNAMIDCGAMFRPHLFATTIQPVMRYRGIGSVQTVLLTHEDRDHTSALPDIQACLSPTVYHHLTAAQNSIDGGSCRLEVLSPPQASHLKGNDASAVIRLSFAGRAILFTGDIQDQGIAQLLASSPDLHADVLLAPHHGSAVPSTTRLIEAVGPTWVICSSDPKLSGRQRRFDALCRGRSQVLRTGRSGAITVMISPSGVLNVTAYADD